MNKESGKAALAFIDTNGDIRVIWGADGEEWFDPSPLRAMAARLKKKGVVGLSRREVSSVKREWFNLHGKRPACKVAR